MKKKNLTFKILSILFTVIFILYTLPIGTFAKGEEKAVNAETNETSLDYSILNTETDNIYNKIHFYFDDADNTTIDDMNELIDATSKLAADNDSLTSVQRTYNNEASEIKLTVQFASNFMGTAEYKAFAQERESLDSIEDVREFRSRLNAFSKEYHNQIITENISLLEAFDYNSVEAVGYSPFVILDIDANEITSDTLLAVAELESISSISLSNKETPEAETSYENVFNAINAYEIIENETYTGSGIRIGILESYICDVSHVNLSDKNITVRAGSTATSDHATIVASVLTTIAPDAEYYVSNLREGEVGIQWFIDMGCDIVNCSFGYYLNDGPDENNLFTDGTKQYRNDIDGIYDYQILAHFVTVVKSTGNYSNDQTNVGYNPQNKVTSPGYAHNVITVGGVRKVSSSSGYYLEHHPDASYVTPTACTKPNISAINVVTVPSFGTRSGTSLATPQVTGCIALLMESNNDYCVYPERTLSLLASTAQKTYDYVENAGNFNQKVGAGVIDLQRMLDSNTYYRVSNANESGDSEVASITVSLREGQKLQAGLAWLATAVNSSSTGMNITDVIVTDYDLKIYSPSGDLFSSTRNSSNVELVRLTAEEFGNYRIVLYQYDPLDERIDGEWLFLTYNISN